VDREPAAARSSHAPGVFDGIRILDLSRVLAGPHCGQLFADFGAEVIKVEDVGGDENRRWEPVIEGQSANYASVNRGKRGMTLNLKHPEGQAILHALVAKSDVVIDSFLPDTAARLGVDDAALRALNPDLVHVTISGYGDVGPMRDRPGYDLMLQAFSGMMSITGEPGGAPVRAGPSLIDMTTGVLAFSGAACALYARLAGTSGGQHVKVSLLETAFSLLGYHVVDCAASGVQPVKGGSGVWHLVPYQAFRTRDGWVLTGATNDASWRRMCVVLGIADFGLRAEFATALDRIRNRDALIARLASIFATHDTGHWVGLLEAARLPCAPVNELRQAIAHPQVAATGMVVEVDDSAGVRRRLVGNPINLSATPARMGCAPPYLGEHTRQILERELGFDTERIEHLRRAGAI